MKTHSNSETYRPGTPPQFKYLRCQDSGPEPGMSETVAQCGRLWGGIPDLLRSELGEWENKAGQSCFDDCTQKHGFPQRNNHHVLPPAMFRMFQKCWWCCESDLIFQMFSAVHVLKRLKVAGASSDAAEANENTRICPKLTLVLLVSLLYSSN